MPKTSDRQELVVQSTICNLLNEMQERPLVLSIKTVELDCFMRAAILRLKLMPGIYHRYWAGKIILSITRVNA